MSDLICVKCGEPWNAYGVNHGDMKAWETDLFKKGAGCPCCKGNASIQLDRVDIDSVLTEEGNLIVPSEIKWEKPSLKILFKCECCKTDFGIDQDDIFYDGSEIKFDEELKPESHKVEDGLICDECRRLKYSRCDYCAKLVHIDDSTYSQSLNRVACDQCSDDGKHWSVCNQCESDTEETEKYNDTWICKSCYSDHELDCNQCGKTILDTDSVDREFCSTECKEKYESDES